MKLDNFDPAALNIDIHYLFSLKVMVNHLQIILDDIDLEADPRLIEPGDLDLMPEMLGDLKSTLGAVTQITARMYLMEKQD